MMLAKLTSLRMQVFYSTVPPYPAMILQTCPTSFAAPISANVGTLGGVEGIDLPLYRVLLPS